MAPGAGQRFVRRAGDEGATQISVRIQRAIAGYYGFVIALPSGYEMDELPPPLDMDYSFASYHSKTGASGQTLHCTRSLEIKELMYRPAKSMS
jgi:hypothetical protein